MTIFLSIIVFLVIFSVLVLIHELGHFWAARKSGIKVEEFGFGLPPRAWGKETISEISYTDKNGKIHKTKEKMIWSLNWIPFGGFVRMFGEDDGSKEAKNDPRAFSNRPIGWRILTVCAGVIMNFLLGWFLLSVAFTLGSEPLILSETDIQKNIDSGVIEVSSGVQVAGVLEGGPSHNAKIQEEDVIITVDQTAIRNTNDLLQKLKEDTMGDGFHFTILRKNEVGEKEQLIKIIKPDSEGRVGILLAPFPPLEKINKIQYPFYEATIYAAKETVRLSTLTVKMLGGVVVSIVKKFSVPEGVAGPVGIAQMTHKFVELGDVVKIIVFMALISISLAVVNIMPFPALDGGRLLFLLFELVTGKKANAKWEAWIHGAGIAILLGLIFLVTWQDIVRIFSG